MSSFLKVRGIGAFKHKSGEFAALSLYFPKKNEVGQLVYTFLTCEIYLVKDLRVNLLIDNNIISPEGFIIDVKEKSTLIGSCSVTILIDTKQKGQFLTRRLLVSQEIMVSAQLEAMVLLVPLPLSNHHDFLFFPATQVKLTLFTHIIDHKILIILVRNTSNEGLCIPYHHKLKNSIDIAYNKCFLTKA